MSRLHKPYWTRMHLRMVFLSSTQPWGWEVWDRLGPMVIARKHLSVEGQVWLISWSNVYTTMPQEMVQTMPTFVVFVPSMLQNRWIWSITNFYLLFLNFRHPYRRHLLIYVWRTHQVVLNLATSLSGYRLGITHSVRLKSILKFGPDQKHKTNSLPYRLDPALSSVTTKMPR